jgi:hypothetical protein
MARCHRLRMPLHPVNGRTFPWRTKLNTSGSMVTSRPPCCEARRRSSRTTSPIPRSGVSTARRPSRPPEISRTASSVRSSPAPTRSAADSNILVMCEVLLASTMRPHPSNTRAACARVEKKFAADEMLFGLEQEYTMLRPGRHPPRLPPRRRPARSRRAPTTAVSAPAASWAATSSKSTPRPVSTLGS